MAPPGALTPEILNQFRASFNADPKNILAQNACTRINPYEVCLSRKTLENTQRAFTHKIEVEGKPVTNQKSSGRCWIFACLNVIRTAFMKQYNLEEFEFSPAYVFFCDKVERCNYFLRNIVITAQKNEPIDGRLVSYLLTDPLYDGGQWDMLVNIINRYGLVPKSCFSESYNSEATNRMNCILTNKLREYARDLRNLVKDGATEEKIQAEILNRMTVIYRIIGICIGVPSETITWEYYDKSKNYHRVGPVTPLEFYQKYVKPYFNVDDKICLVTDPRTSNPYGKLYTVSYLGNVVGGRSVIYNNQPAEVLMELCAESIKNNEPVWFGCDFRRRISNKYGIQDLEVFDFQSTFGTNVEMGLSKAERLMYGDSMMIHAMVFTAVSIDEDGKISKFRVENSHGDENGVKGYYTLTAPWFSEFVFEVVIDKKLVPANILDVLKQDPVVLPAWDPMGALAQ